jgi:hypothetical protein
MPSHVRTQLRFSVVLIAAKCHCQAAEFILHVYLKIRFKALNTIINGAEYTITRKRVFLFPCLKTLLRHSIRWTLCNHHEPSCGLRYCWESRYHKVLTYVEYRAVSGVFQNIDPPPPLHPASVSSPRTKGGGGGGGGWYTLVGRWGGWGVNSLER